MIEVDARQAQQIRELVAGGLDPDEAVRKVLTTPAPTLAPIVEPKKRSKFGNIRVEEDGHTFDSKKEARRYRELRLMERSGEIDKLELQPVYRFEHNGVLIGKYTPDFRYEDTRTGELIVEDVKAESKAARSRDYILRKKMLKAFYGIDVQEV